MSKKFYVDPEAVQTLAKLLHESDLSEIEYQHSGCRVRVVRSHSSDFPSLSYDIPFKNPPQESKKLTREPPVSSGEALDVSAEKTITSPMVGTLYLAPGPNEAPYISVGKHIEEGQTLFIIEAMKVMNPIRSTESGVVTKICVADGALVEFGEILVYVS